MLTRRRFGVRRLLGRRSGLVATTIVGMVIAAAATAIALITLDTDGHHGGPRPSSARSDPGIRESRQAWARQYGQDRSTMPDLPNVAAATPAQKAAAADLLSRTQSSTAPFADSAKAQAAGFDLPAALRRAEDAAPRLAQRLQQIDAGRHLTKLPTLAVVNTANTHDGKVLDPTAPEMLIYQYQGHNNWKLIGAGYLGNESYPHAPPDPGGPITRWHYDDKHPAVLSMEVFFMPQSDLVHAYALSSP